MHDDRTDLFETAEKQVCAIVIDDHVAMRNGLELLLMRCGFRVVPGAATAAQGHAAVVERSPDVAIIDMRLGGDSGIELTRRLLERVPGLGVLLYTGVLDPPLLRAGIESGARGVALKSLEPRALIEALRTVARGTPYLDPAVSRAIAAEPQNILSPRERDVLRLLARGCSGEETARELALAPETVRTHVRNARRKLGASTRTHAVAAALQSREIEL